MCLALQTSEQFCLKARTRQTIRCRASSYPPQSHKSPGPCSRWPLSNFRMNRIAYLQKPESSRSPSGISEETMHDDSFVRFDTIPECDGQTDGKTDRGTDGHLCYCNTSACMACYATVLVKIHAWAWASWGRPRRPPDFPPGLCFWIRLGDWDFRPRDSFASHHLTWNPEYAPEFGAAFSTPAISVNTGRAPAANDFWRYIHNIVRFHACFRAFSNPARLTKPKI